MQHRCYKYQNNCKTSLVVLYSQNYVARMCGHYLESSDCFEHPPPQKNPYLIKPPKKILAKFSYPKKMPESNISNSKKSLHHPCQLKSGVSPPPCDTGYTRYTDCTRVYRVCKDIQGVEGSTVEYTGYTREYRVYYLEYKGYTRYTGCTRVYRV